MSLAKDKLVAFAQSIIRVPSLSGDEEAVVQRIAAEMRMLAFDRVHVDACGSLIGEIDGARPGRTLLLDGHCDVVGIAPGASWQEEPYGASLHDGRIYGRGSSDMKGALAAMIYAAAAVDHSQLAGKLAVSATVMEEVMEGVALGKVLKQLQPDYVVVGEATDLNLARGGRGRAEIHLESRGKPAHSSTPHLGDNAVHRMLPALQAIENAQLPADPFLGDAIMTLTDIISEPYPGHSVIPTRCRVTYDRRLLTGETEESVLDALRSLPALAGIAAVVAEGDYDTYTGARLRGPKFFPAWEVAPDHELVAWALAGLHQAGLAPGSRAYRFCTNAAQSAGRDCIPTIGFGPSAEGQAHVVDEYIELEQLFAATRGYMGIIEAILSPSS